MSTSHRTNRINCPPPEYVSAQVSAIANQYCPLSNPSGSLPMAVAENKLLSTKLLERMNGFSGFNASCLNYADGTGIPRLKSVLARLLQERIFRIDDRISPSNLVVSSGCTALLYQLSFCLFNEGDSVLIPTPLYPAFIPDFLNIGGVTVMGVNAVDGAVSGELTVDAMEAAHQRACDLGYPPRGLLLASPNNPLGTIYSVETLTNVVSFCRDHNLHFICDEVYALSLFRPSEVTDESSQANAHSQEFVSIVSILENKLGDDVHVLYSLSKDFGASGLRMGVLYTQNEHLLGALRRSNDAFQCSGMLQEWACSLLEDQDFLDEYILQNQAALGDAYQFLTHNLKEIGVSVVPAAAGVFCYANFRRFLTEDTREGELALFWRLVRGNEDGAGGGVVFTPGSTCRCTQFGYFRICFAWVDRAGLTEAVRRLRLNFSKELESLKS